MYTRELNSRGRTVRILPLAKGEAIGADREALALHEPAGLEVSKIQIRERFRDVLLVGDYLNPHHRLRIVQPQDQHSPQSVYPEQ